MMLYKDYLYCFIISVIIVLLQLELIFDQFEFYSDNYYYKLAFDGLSSKSLFDAYAWFVWKTSGSEPFSFFVFYIFSHILEYRNFISFIDVLFYWIILVFYRKIKINYIFIFIFVFLNYYFLIMSIGVHRIKLAFIFLFVFFIVKSSRRIYCLILAPLFHFQVFSVYIPALFARFVSDLLKRKILKQSLTLFLFMVSVILLLVSFTKIFSKFVSRLSLNFEDGFVSLLFVFLYIYISREKRIGVFVYLLFISIEIFLIGGFRMNMILFFSFFTLLYLYDRRKFIAYNFAASVYFLCKILIFYTDHYIKNIILY